MASSLIIRSGDLTAGVLSQHPHKSSFVFHAANPAFATLDGSSFANRHAIQRAVDRLAQTQGLASSIAA
jgi:hypothetical protein